MRRSALVVLMAGHFRGKNRPFDQSANSFQYRGQGHGYLGREWQLSGTYLHCKGNLTNVLMGD
ncbi:MAG TPA: hypothetical protein VIZ21_08215, partial [Ignavibacteriaceae bacterium]